MEILYRNNKNVTSLLKYHFIFCPRYRRKIFLIDGVKERFKELIRNKCAELQIEIISMECGEDHAYLFLDCLPDHSPSDIMQALKSYTSKVLREEFDQLSKMPGLWTRSYCVSTKEDISDEAIKNYVNQQKKKYY